jgi:N-acetylmuramoyl-L-alanine amidase
MKINAVVFAALLFASTVATSQSQNALLQKAHQAYTAAQSLEAELNEKSEPERTRSDYLKVIKAYERVYLTTPKTGYADDSLIGIARLYEEMKDDADAVKTLRFLIREYPTSPFRDSAEKDITRLSGAKVQKIAVTTQDGLRYVDNVRYWEEQNSIRVIVDLNGEITFSQGEARNPNRVFVDIAQAKLNSVLIGKQWQVRSPLLEQIRVGQFDNSTVRVVLDVGTIGRVTSFTLRDPDRLVIDILGKETPTIAPIQPPPVPTTTRTQAPALISAAPTLTPSLPAAPPEPKRSSATTTTPMPDIAASIPSRSSTPPSSPSTSTAVATTTTTSTTAAASTNTAGSTNTAVKKPADANAKPITPAKTTNSGARSLVRSLGLKLSRVVIDAGHGGRDTGTVGPNGYTEKELVLDVAQRLKQLIETELGAEVVMTRTDDSFVPLETRTTLANQQEADLFISIHANSSRVRTVRGVETYFLNFTSSRESLETASRENAASDRSIHELQDLVKKIMLRDKVDESRELAQHIDRAMAARRGSGIDRGVKQAPFVVLIGANMPSVLAEICFISNPQDEKSVKTTEQRQAIAESLFAGVRSYAETLSGTKTAKTQDKTN